MSASEDGELQPGGLREFSGPLPHPLVLEQYNRVMPGLAEKIWLQTEASLAMQREAQTADIELRKAQVEIIRTRVADAGQLQKLRLALLAGVSLLCILIGAGLVVLGHQLSGFVALLTAVAAFATAMMRTSLRAPDTERQAEEE